MSRTLELTDKYGDKLELLQLSTGNLDLTFIDSPEQEGEEEFTLILEPAEQEKLRAFFGAPSVENASHRPMTDPNEAKLRVAAQFDLRARFDYKGEQDAYDRPRRVKVEVVFTDHAGDLLVAGESFDEDGEGEGYRQFRLDRITSAVTVR